MPNGIYPVPNSVQSRKQAGGSSRGSSTSAALRFKTWWRRGRLDKQLARGTSPEESAELRLRSEQLEDRSERARLADALEGAVREASEPAAFQSLAVRRPEVRACADGMVELARRLRDGRPINVRGIAETAVLLSDGKSPLYSARASLSLPEALRAARLALDEGGQTPSVNLSTAA